MREIFLPPVHVGISLIGHNQPSPLTAPSHSLCLHRYPAQKQSQDQRSYGNVMRVTPRSPVETHIPRHAYLPSDGGLTQRPPFMVPATPPLLYPSGLGVCRMTPQLITEDWVVGFILFHLPPGEVGGLITVLGVYPSRRSKILPAYLPRYLTRWTTLPNQFTLAACNPSSALSQGQWEFVGFLRNPSRWSSRRVYFISLTSGRGRRGHKVLGVTRVLPALPRQSDNLPAYLPR